jgi:hypothetical protein
MLEKRVPATSAASRRASHILLEKGPPAPRLSREFCARKALCLSHLAATHATKTRVPAPGRAPYSRKALRPPPGQHPDRKKTLAPPAERGSKV